MCGIDYGKSDEVTFVYRFKERSKCMENNE